jgi:hypothetical protein
LVGIYTLDQGNRTTKLGWSHHRQQKPNPVSSFLTTCTAITWTNFGYLFLFIYLFISIYILTFPNRSCASVMASGDLGQHTLLKRISESVKPFVVKILKWTKLTILYFLDLCGIEYCETYRRTWNNIKKLAGKCPTKVKLDWKLYGSAIIGNFMAPSMAPPFLYFILTPGIHHPRTQGLFGRDPGIFWSRDSTKFNCPRGSGKVSNYMLPKKTLNFKYQEWVYDT